MQKTRARGAAQRLPEEPGCAAPGTGLDREGGKQPFARG